MKPAPPFRTLLRIADIKARLRIPRVPFVLLNCRVPSQLDDQLRTIAAHLNCAKTELVIALLIKGLAQAAKRKKRARKRR